MTHETMQQPAGHRVAGKHRRMWWRVLLGGLLLYVLGLAIMLATGNPNLFPTVILLGNFLVPVSYVVFFWERQQLTGVRLPDVALSFLCGGVLGTFSAGVLEPVFIRQLDLATTFEVGLIEEGVKIIALLSLVRIRALRHDVEIDGVILGAAAGMGFAALESMGYAFTVFLASGGSPSATVGTTLLRGLLAPVGHGTWTAILAGVLFRESVGDRFRINRHVILAYLGVALLHGLWDGLPPIIAFITDSGTDVLVGQVIVGAVGLLVLRHIWCQGLHRLAPDAPQYAPATATEQPA